MRTNGNYSNENREMINSISNFFKPVHVPHPRRSEFETVEQFQARGGIIEKLEPGDTSETLRKQASEERQRKWAAGKLITSI